MKVSGNKSHVYLLNRLLSKRLQIQFVYYNYGVKSDFDWLIKDLEAMPKCHTCGRYAQPKTGAQLLVCGRCKRVHYCCKEHQKADWVKKEGGHKKFRKSNKYNVRNTW